MAFAGDIFLQPFPNAQGLDSKWIDLISQQCPGHKVISWTSKSSTLSHDELESLVNVEYAIVYSVKLKDLARLPRLRVVLLRGVGCDGLGPLNDLPSHIPIVRLEDKTVFRNMALYVLHWVLHVHMRFNEYLTDSANSVWEKRPIFKPVESFTVAVIGTGSVGSTICKTLAKNGYRVLGWSRSAREVDGVETFSAGQLDKVLEQSDAVVNVLPSTKDTSGMFNRAMFEKMRRGTVFINVGRGDTVEASALAEALDNGQVEAAVLDVTNPEPLPKDSMLWRQGGVFITPHVAGTAVPASSAQYVIDNILRVREGTEPYPKVDRVRGY